MRKTSFALALLTAAALTACGGSSPRAGDQTPATKFSAQVSFGDSLSDVGTYAVGTVKALGGGKFTINGDNTSISPDLTGKNWTEFVAAQLQLPVPCPAQTGLQGNAAQGLNVPITFNVNCLNYAQGGSRVTNPVGPGNALTGAALGATTVPVVTQIANHLAKTGGKFSGTELVTVMAGGNDILFLLGQLSTNATAAGTAAGAQTFAVSLATQLAAGATNPTTAFQSIVLAIQTESARAGHTNDTIVAAAVQAAVLAGNTPAAQSTVYLPMAAKAKADADAAGQQAGATYLTNNGPGVVTAMATAGGQLAALVKTQIVGKGANYVVVNNLPDVASTPSGKSQPAAVQTLIQTAVDAFNAQLKAGVAGDPKILYVDLWTVSHDEVINPAPYGLTNTSTPACGPNALGTTSLVCNAKNVIAGDVSHYMFADDVHPTPFENWLVARYVLEQMATKGWL
ncbi:SGNH/GDSL hydrolase family protein [Massilia pinisoli]|uniref:SGNH/GDSL hydrolase family protein n=1 Tax=Massilia pinisoli TaxID=1772194 RepID=A0ABT1ZYS1_9BURK|nr:SGNH/GDSL hydrolase family protein [Massilia pinisoli]MCS0585029.1 SGNH/GDSL hydrolase family protein [Massilia pinisoli]